MIQKWVSNKVRKITMNERILDKEIQLSLSVEEIIQDYRCAYKSLITVISGTKIPFLEGMRHSYLHDFFPIAKDSEFSFSAHHLS
jgi:hypothetical protein